MKATSTIFALGFVAGQVSAGSWTDATSYSTPYNSDNVCSSTQKHGFNWTSLQSGGFNGYGGFQFSGFNCEDKFAKAPLFNGIPYTGNGYQNKVISGQLVKGVGPSIAFPDGTFSPDVFQITPSLDINLDMIYTLSDNSTCKQSAFVPMVGKTITNTQCGGAKSLTFQLPTDSSYDTCFIGIHTISYHCQSNSTASSYPTASATKSYVSASPYVSYNSSTATKPAQYYSSASGYHSVPTTYSFANSSYYGYKPASTPSPRVYTSPVVYTHSAISTYPSGYTVKTTLTTPKISVITKPTYTLITSTPSSASPVVITKPTVIYETTTCSAGYVDTTILSVPVVSTIPIYSSAKLTKTVFASDTPVSVYPAPTSAPSTVPNCIKTWLDQTQCKDTLDKSCYCKDSSFANNVIQCLVSHGADNSEVKAAISQLQGICASYIPGNPALITGVPGGYAPPKPTASLCSKSGSSSITPIASEVSGSSTTISFQYTCTTGPNPSVITTVVTVPVVTLPTPTNSVPYYPATGFSSVSTASGYIPGYPSIHPSAPIPVYPTGTLVSPPPSAYTGAASSNGVTRGSFCLAALVAMKLLL